MVELICDAIRRRHLISFGYEGHSRVVEPHTYGQNEAGHDMLSAWLVRGYTKSGTAGGWRNYLVADIQGVTVMEEEFAGPRPGYNPSDRRFGRFYCRLE